MEVTAMKEQNGDVQVCNYRVRRERYYEPHRRRRQEHRDRRREKHPHVRPVGRQVLFGKQLEDVGRRL